MISMSQESSKFQAYHVGDFEKIILAACNMIGVTPESAFDAVAKKLNGPSELKLSTITEMTVTEWFYLCQILNLHLDTISFGYIPHVHKRLIGEAIYSGKYYFPLTVEVKEIWKIYKNELKEQRKNELTHYGTRLRRKIKRDHIKNDFHAFIARTVGSNENLIH